MIVSKYEINPVAHIQLLKGQTKRSDAGATIKKDYYIFEVKDKCTHECIDYIQCGMGAARDFLGLLNHKGLPIFNPLHVTSGSKETNYRGDNKVNKGNTARWNPTARQLYNAIMWLIVIWDAKPGTPLFDFKEDIEKYSSVEPFSWKIKRVNSVIKNGAKGLSLTEMIKKYRIDNEVRDELCEFNLLDEVLVNYKDKSGLPMMIQSYF